MNDKKSRSLLPRVAWSTALVGVLGLTGCATESSRALVTPKAEVAPVAAVSRTQRVAVALGHIENKSAFQRGAFSDGVDRLGGQMRAAVASHLQQSNRFAVLEREGLAEMKQEAQIGAKTQQLRGADFLITGGVTEFGRKETGDQQLFGILGRGKEQIAYAKVILNVVNVRTSEVVFSAQGAGEYALSQREVIGFGGTATYDATLNGKVVDLAVREVVGKLAAGVDAGVWGSDNGGVR